MSTRAKGSFLCLFGAACWGVSGCTGQYLFTYQGMDSTWLVPIRLFLAGLLISSYYFVRDRKLLIAPWKTAHNARDLIIYGLIGVSGAQFTYLLTIQPSSAGFGTIIQDISPAMILVCVCVCARRRPRIQEISSIALALVGVFFITTHGRLDALAVSPWALLIGVISAICVVIYTMIPGKLQAQFPTALLQGWAFLMGGAFFALVFRPWGMHYVPSFIGILGIIVVVVVGNVLAFSCYMQGVKLIGPRRASLYSFAEPVAAALISTLFLGSPFTLWDALGFVCIFTMLVLLSLRKDQ